MKYGFKNRTKNWNVEDIQNGLVLQTIYGVKQLMEEILQGYNMCVVSQCKDQFSPIGVTILYSLSESHSNIHTYIEKERVVLIYVLVILKQI